jgi:plastocyanin
MSANDSTPTRPDPSVRGFILFIATVTLVLAIGAVIAVALKLSDGHSAGVGPGMMSGSGFHRHPMGSYHHPMMGTNAVVESGAGAVEEVRIVAKSDEEQAKLGPEGAWHDAFLPADFSVKPGATVRVTVYNYDEGAHTFTSAGLGANVTIAAGSAEKPSVTTFTFRAPVKAGRYSWYCAIPCDPWAMGHDGYMRGHVTVT